MKIFNGIPRRALCLCLLTFLSLSSGLSAALTMRTDNQSEGALGWVSAPNFTSDQAINLSVFDDWIIANNAGSVPGVLVQKAGVDFLRLEEINEGVQSGANRVDPWHVYFDWDNGTSLPTAEGYHGVSWVMANAEPYAFMRFRADVGSNSGQIAHFWNHNLQQLPHQRLTVTLHAADGTERARQEFINSVDTAYYTSLIGFTGEAEGDFIEILNIGQNVGWRATALIFEDVQSPPPPTVPFIFEDSEQTILLGSDWAWNSVLGNFWYGTWPWIYQPESESWWHVTGDSEDSYFLLSVETNQWFFASQSLYPQLYSYQLLQWINLQ